MELGGKMMGITQDPVTELELITENERPDRQKDVV
jgi:hypothetical protein